MPHSHPFDMKQVSTLKSTELFSLIEDWLNYHGGMSATDALTDELVSSHRTLQQDFVRFFFSALCKYGRHPHTKYFDDRNEASVKLCHKLVELVDTKVLDEYIPYI